jgi:hypothetical protein
MPDGAEVMVPVPVPARVWVSAYVFMVNVAVTFRAAFPCTTQVPEPVQSPLQPVNVDPGLGLGVSVAVASHVSAPTQSVPQLIPATAESTEPEPVPALVTVTELRCSE